MFLHADIGEPPDEYVEYVMCRYVWPGCTPDELDRQDAARVFSALACYTMENEVTKPRRGRRK